MSRKAIQNNINFFQVNYVQLLEPKQLIWPVRYLTEMQVEIKRDSRRIGNKRCNYINVVVHTSYAVNRDEQKRRKHVGD